MRRHQGGTRVLTSMCVVGLVAALAMPTTAAASTVPNKNETAYVQTDASGAVTEVTVDVLLSNERGAETLEDRTSLVDIKVGDEAQSFEGSQGGSLTWSTGGRPVSYRGTSNDEPPVSVQLRYTLDGRQVMPEELAGASGHLVMRIDYANASSSGRRVSGSDRQVMTPFVCVSLVTFDADLAKNVTVTNGSVMEDKGGCAVVGYAVPGLEQSLGSDIEDLDLDLPTSVEIEADVTDFALDPVQTFVTAELFEDLDGSRIGEKGTGASTDALTDAMAQLVSGSATLAGSLDQLARGGSELGGGVTALREALGELPSGLAELRSGAQTLSDRLSEASSVAGGLAQGSSDLSGAAARSLEGMGGAAEGVAQASSTVAILLDEVDGLHLDDLGEDVAAAAQAARDAQGALAGARDALGQVGQTADEQRGQVADGLVAARGSLDALLADESLELTEEQRALLETRLGAIQEQIDGSLATLGAIDLSVPEEALDAEATLAGAADELSTRSEAIEGAAPDLSPIGTRSQEALADLDAAAQMLQGSQETLEAVVQGSQGMAGALTGMSEGLAAAHDGADLLVGGIDAMATKAPAALQGVEALQSGIGQLSEGISAAAQGSGTLTSGLATFRDEGIAKVVDALAGLDESLQSVSDDLEALSDAAAAYDTFSGKVDGQSGSVRFIFQTEAIGR